MFFTEVANFRAFDIQDTDDAVFEHEGDRQFRSGLFDDFNVAGICSDVINDQGSWWQPSDPSEEAIPALLASRGVRWTDLTGWHRLDGHEVGLGAPHGRARIKVVPRPEMVDISRGE